MQPAHTTDSPKLRPFLSILWQEQQPGEHLDPNLPAHVYIGSGHYSESGYSTEVAYEIRLVGVGKGPGREPELVDTTVSLLHPCSYLPDLTP